MVVEMAQNQNDDTLFDFVYSLPALGHSEAIVRRRLCSIFKQPLRYIPDYGGIMEVPGTILKSHSLSQSLPFEPIPKVKLIACNAGASSQVIAEDSLCVTSHCGSSSGLQLSTIRAIGKSIHFNTFIEDSTLDAFTTSNYHVVPYKNNISAIKYRKNIPDLLIVKFDNCIRTIKLDYEDSGSLRQVCSSFYGTLLEKRGLKVQDASMNFASKSLLAVASENKTICQVKLYDLERSNYSIVPSYTITWPASNNEPTVIDDRVGYVDGKFVQGHVVRTFIPQGSNLKIQQLDNIPSHIANLLVTTSSKVMLIDPRIDKLGQVYVDRTKLPSFHAIEHLKRTEFSEKNSYQFYSLSNLNLRVFDTRYPRMPMNQISHMMESDTSYAMNIRVSAGENNSIETICLSSCDKLCFMAFDQTQRTNLINPNSMHMPFHDSRHELSTPEKVERMSGLELIRSGYKSRDCLLSVLQLTSKGDIYMKHYAQKRNECPMEVELQDSKNKAMTMNNYAHDKLNYELQSNKSRNDVLHKFAVEEADDNYFDILQQEVIDYDDKITSTTALQRYKKAVNILNKIA